tara:strand:- start:60 stop:359 length:300 start_codon:yes stop_codon:yes gene_type:complete
LSWFVYFIDFVFAIGLFINAALFVPQAYRLLKLKDSSELSLVTFVGFLLTQLSAIFYGIIHTDYILVVGYVLAFISCGWVTILIDQISRNSEKSIRFAK